MTSKKTLVLAVVCDIVANMKKTIGLLSGSGSGDEETDACDCEKDGKAL